MTIDTRLSPIASYAGEPVTVLPHDLFIPPDALIVLLASFEGPLDLLYYLIKHQNINILDIPVTLIAQQYTQYIQMMALHRLELAAEYLVMAAMLAEIKSRMLLPAGPLSSQEDEIDPRAELVNKLQAYEQMKAVAHTLDALPRLERDIFAITLAVSGSMPEPLLPQPTLRELLTAYHGILQEQIMGATHQITRERLSTRQKMDEIMRYLQDHPRAVIRVLCTRAEGRMGLVTTFLAILELTRLACIALITSDISQDWYITAVPTHD